jgi:hypothetical protein
MTKEESGEEKKAEVQFNDQAMIESLEKYRATVTNSVLWTDDQLEFLKEMCEMLAYRINTDQADPISSRNVPGVILDKFCIEKGYVRTNKGNTEVQMSFTDVLKSKDEFYEAQQKVLEARDKDGKA